MQKHCFSYRRSVRLSVCPSVRHTLRFCQNDANYDHGIFTISTLHDSSFRIRKATAEIRKESPGSRALNERR